MINVIFRFFQGISMTGKDILKNIFSPYIFYITPNWCKLIVYDILRAKEGSPPGAAPAAPSDGAGGTGAEPEGKSQDAARNATTAGLPTRLAPRAPAGAPPPPPKDARRTTGRD